MNYVLENGICRIEVSSRGGELQSVRKDGAEYLWQADPAYWREKAPNLFPYIGRMTEGSYQLDGHTYHMSIHGFVHTMELVREEQSRERIVFRLNADAETLACYPRDFTYRVIYELDENVLNVTYRVENHDEDIMYFAVGGHPGIRVPMGDSREISENGEVFEDYYLEFEELREGEVPVRIGFSPSCFVSGENVPYPLENGRIPLRHELFDNDAIVLANAPKAVTLKSGKSGRSVRVSYPNMNYIGFWHATKKPTPYVCIEPWSSLPSRQDVVEDLAAQPGLIRLAPGKVYENSWSMEFN